MIQKNYIIQQGPVLAGGSIAAKLDGRVWRPRSFGKRCSAVIILIFTMLIHKTTA